MKTALVLIAALALPGAAHALGLGEIRVDSALNEPLAAEVDLVGATAEDLSQVSASIADSETFVRFGVDRPAFLSTASFRIATGRGGQPNLVIRSAAAFTEPLINVLIDLHWRSGELIRQYTLLLDPPGFPADSRFADRAAGGGESSSAAVSSPGPVKVTVGATLHGIAARASSRGNARLESMMVAIYRANPTAFEGNINRLRLGAALTIPSSSEVSRISPAEANREIQLQMDAWRATAKLSSSTKLNAPATAAPARVPVKTEVRVAPLAARQESAPEKSASSGAIIASASGAEAADDKSLDSRINLLQAGLEELQGALRREQQTLAGIQAMVSRDDGTPAAPLVRATPRPGHTFATMLAAALVLVVLGIGYTWRRRLFYGDVSPAAAAPQNTDARQIVVHTVANREPALAQPRREDGKKDQVGQLGAAAAERSIAAAATRGVAAISETNSLAATATEIRAHDSNAETTPLKAVGDTEMPEVPGATPENALDADESQADTAKLQYKFLDLDGAVHHVPMPSLLYEKGQFKERRTSLVDVLKVAVKREPNRRDLRMKLLETYYAAAATSRQGFLEIAQSLIGERASMAEAEWGKIAGMGRLIAADHVLFTR